MAAEALPDNLKELFLTKYNSVGNAQFYNFLVSYAMDLIDNRKFDKRKMPDVMLYEYYEIFLDLFRKEGNVLYLQISSQFRRASNTIYRELLKQKLTRKNSKFLNVV